MNHIVLTEIAYLYAISNGPPSQALMYYIYKSFYSYSLASSCVANEFSPSLEILYLLYNLQAYQGLKYVLRIGTKELVRNKEYTSVIIPP